MVNKKRSILISILIISILVISLGLIITVQEFAKSYNEKNVVETEQVLFDAQQNNLGGLSGLSLLDNGREDDDNFESSFLSSSGGSRGGGSSSSSSSSSSSDTDLSSQDSDSGESDNLDNPSEDSTTDSNNEETDPVNDENEDSETENNPSDNFDSVDNENDLSNNPKSSDDKKSMIDDENEDFIDVIVMLKDDGIFKDDRRMLGITKSALPEIELEVKRKQASVLSKLDSIEFHLKHKYNTISGFAGKITKEGLDKLKQDPNVEAIYEDELLYTTLIESVPLINADDVHNLGITGEGSVVCVVDTGIDYTHPALGGCLGSGCKVLDGYDFYNNDDNPMDEDGHGTHVAGIVAANRGTTSDITDTVGSWTYTFLGEDRGRGNNWYANESVTINEIEMYLGISSSTTLYWFVYENPTANGNFMKIFETSTTSGTGQKFYSSGDISIELEAGKYYLMGAWWGSTSVIYGRGNEIVPFNVSFGKLQTGIPSSPTASTPPDTWNFIYSGYSPDYGPYYSRITTNKTSTITQLRGVAPDAELVALKVCGPIGCWGSDMIAGVDWCNSKSSTYNIVATTMSIGDSGEYDSATCPTWMDSAINTAHNLGIAVTVASGNDYYSNGISYPACSPNAISVGSTTKADDISGFTNTGILLDLLAPGSSIYSTIIGGGYATHSGTSMAAPHVAGAIALAKEYAPLALPDQIEEVLKRSGIPITDHSGLIFPRIDLLAAWNYDECSSNSDCGTDGYTGDLFCQNGDVWQDYTTYTCELDVYCLDSTAPKLIEECEHGCTEGRCKIEICNFGKCYYY